MAKETSRATTPPPTDATTAASDHTPIVSRSRQSASTSLASKEETSGSAEPFAVHRRELYQTLLATRNLEIGLFWQRSNYFLVLNTGLAFAYFNLSEDKYTLVFAVMGVVASTLWFRVCLGGKFWQTRWEQRLKQFEEEHMPGLNFFSATKERIREDVESGLTLKDHGRLKRFFYRLALRKPSVSFAMILLSALFIGGWIVVLGLGLYNAFIG